MKNGRLRRKIYRLPIKICRLHRNNNKLLILAWVSSIIVVIQCF